MILTGATIAAMNSPTPRRMTKAAHARQADIVTMRAQGMSYAQIGQLLRISRQRIHQIVQDAARHKGNDDAKASA